MAPSATNTYYSEFYKDVILFFSGLIESSHQDDLFLVVADEATQPQISDHIPQQNLLLGSVPDIWIRDFAPVRTTAGSFKFQYSPAYLGKRDAQYVEKGFVRWFRSVGLEAEDIPLVLDGGNFCYNGGDSAVVTERILKDNMSYSREEIAQLLRAELGLENVAIIPEEPGDITGHSDGMVKWLAEHRLGVARFEEPLRSRVLGELEQSLGDVELVELPDEPGGEVWRGWPSASGVYVNALTTENGVYVPLFGLEADETAIEAYRTYSSKPVIPVQTRREEVMGGSLHCLTWQVSRGDARTILESRG